MDIKLYGFDFSLLAVENHYKSVNAEHAFNDIGKLEMHLSLSSPLLPVLASNRYTVAKYGNHAAVVTGWTAKDELVVYGRSCNWLLSKRTVPPFSGDNPIYDTSDPPVQLLPVDDNNIETTARTVAAYAFSDVGDFVLGDLAGITDTASFWRLVRNPAFDVIRDVLDIGACGHRLEFDLDRKKWVFSCLKGRERDFLIAESNRNAYETEYNTDMLDYLSAGYYEDEDGVEDTVDRGDGLSGMARFEGRLSGRSSSEAMSELAKDNYNETMKAKFRNIVFEKDYDLGDTLRIRLDKGKVRTLLRRQVVGVKQNWDGNGYSEQPVLSERTVDTDDELS